MAVITAYDRRGFGLNMAYTESSFVPNSNDLIPDGDPFVTQYDYDTVLISQWYNGHEIALGIYASQYLENIWTIESLYVFDSDTEPTLGAYNVNIRFNITDDFSQGAYFTNLLTGNDVISGNKYADIIKSGAGNDILKGNAGNDNLYGESGNDVLNGGTGADTMLGGSGNDTYYVDIAGDKVYETTTTSSSTNAGGTDLVYSSVSFNLNAYAGVRFVENLTLTGSSNINATGNSLSNKLTGNAKNNVLDGGAGNDTLSGGAGNDILKGGTGKDILYGGSGADKFVFDTALNKTTNLDTIKDFARKSDKIVLDDDIFKAFTGKSAVSSKQFKVVDKVSQLSGDGYLTYVRATDTLYYDANGKGSGDVAFVKIELAGTAAPSASDFQVIA
jgi:Ca2+-binding RTX toxin-like protein